MTNYKTLVLILAWLVALFLISTFTWRTPALGAEIDTAIQKALSASAKVVVIDSAGTAFCINQNLLVTNAHVVNSALDAIIYKTDGVIRHAKVVFKDDDVDLAILKSPGACPTWLKFQPRLPEFGEPVGMCGAPEGVFPICVTGKTLICNLVECYADVVARPGNSGGAVVDKDGHVVGVMRARYLTPPQLGVMIPSSVVINILRKQVADAQD